jgi:hypothetical protein
LENQIFVKKSNFGQKLSFHHTTIEQLPLCDIFSKIAIFAQQFPFLTILAKNRYFEKIAIFCQFLGV